MQLPTSLAWNKSGVGLADWSYYKYGAGLSPFRVVPRRHKCRPGRAHVGNGGGWDCECLDKMFVSRTLSTLSAQSVTSCPHPVLAGFHSARPSATPSQLACGTSHALTALASPVRPAPELIWSHQHRASRSLEAHRSGRPASLSNTPQHPNALGPHQRHNNLLSALRDRSHPLCDPRLQRRPGLRLLYHLISYQPSQPIESRIRLHLESGARCG